MEKILPCVIGLGYVGLPVLLRLKKHFIVKGYDTNSKRINNLKKNIDTNNEFTKKEVKLNKPSLYTNKPNLIKNSNFYIITVPTPILKNFKPDLKYINTACNQVGKILKKGDIIFFESTVFPGVTEEICINTLEKLSKLKAKKDFYIGYSSERINPGDKLHKIDNISKVVSIEANPKIKNIVLKVYKKISKKIIYTQNIKEAELSKLLENTQRDLNISFMNEMMILCNKAKLDFFEVLKLAKTKWNFLDFSPGLVGGHCLPIDPHYLAYYSKKVGFKTNVTLAGRQINNYMKDFICNEIIKKIRKNKIYNNSKKKILLVGITYKKNVSDYRNSLALEIYKKIKLKYKNIVGYDPLLNNEISKKYNIKNNLNNFNNFVGVIFLVNHKSFHKIYKNFKKKNKLTIDIFSFYS